MMKSFKEAKFNDAEERSLVRFFRNRWLAGVSVAVLIVVAALILFGRGGQKAPQPPQAQKGQSAMPVVATAVTKGDFSVYLSGLGSVTPLNTVTLRTHIDGELIKVLFREGQIVSKGELLAEIDPRPFQAQLIQAEGALARDQAQLENAQLDKARYQDLVRKNYIAKQQLDTQDALVRQFEGAVKADQGQIDSAKLQLAYCRITAPFNGRIGLRQVDPGNIVHASDATGLAVITQVQPISVIFALPEDSLAQILARLRTGAHLTVEAYDRDQKQKLATGTLLTVDNQIDPSTGTVKLKAEFPNRNFELFPNQFVNARLIIEVRHDAVIVPSPAVQRGPQGTFVYVVKADQTAALRPISLGISQEGNALITAGLSSGELVVVDGADRLRDGSRVEVKAPNGGASPAATQRQGK